MSTMTLIPEQILDLSKTQPYATVRPYIEPHQGQLLLITKNTGVTVFAVKLNENLAYNEQLIACGLSGLRIFLMDTFNLSNINTMTFDDLFVKMIQIDDIIVYYIFKGEEDTTCLLTSFMERLLGLECWERIKQMNMQIRHKDENEIHLMVREIFQFSE